MSETIRAGTLEIVEIPMDGQATRVGLVFNWDTGGRAVLPLIPAAAARLARELEKVANEVVAADLAAGIVVNLHVADELRAGVSDVSREFTPPTPPPPPQPQPGASA